MGTNQKDLEKIMTPEERELYEKWKSKIGQVYVPRSEQETMADDLVIYFWRLGREASGTWIKRWAAINEDFNPLWFDEEYAKKSRWKGIIAPPLYLISVHDGLEWNHEFAHELYKPGMIPDNDKYPNYSHTFQTETEWEFFEPVRPGDTIDPETRISDLYWKQGSEHRMLFVVCETEFTNQKGQSVGRSRVSAAYLFN
ncbi:MaoC family dehydratase N-terminal domain-containing protein [Thermodesulfobacteriota bacterium]